MAESDAALSATIVDGNHLLMPPSPSAPSPAPECEFATTRWSMILAAGGDAVGAHAALSHLCEAYWYPLYAFIRRQGHRSDEAQDLTQEFLARLLAKGWLGGVDRDRGRFRAWLLVSVKHFLANEWDRAHAVKRGGRVMLVSFDEVAAEERYLAEPSDSEDPARLFDRRWAFTLLDRVLHRLSEEMATAGKLEIFEALKGVLTGGKARYAEIAIALQMSESAVKAAAHRLRERYRAILRAEIADTVSTSAEIDEELRHLFAALSA